MEGSALHPAEPGSTSARPDAGFWERGDRAAKIEFALLCAGFIVGFFVFPTYPVYNSYYSLLWGRDLWHGDGLVFDGFRYQTRRPLTIAAGFLCQFFGEWADRLWVALILASFLVLVAGLYRLGKITATPLVGAVQGGRVAADPLRLSVPRRARLPGHPLHGADRVGRDPRVAAPAARDLPAGAALAHRALRPEAWFLAAMYWCWVAWKATWRQRFIYAALAASGPLIWCAVDYAMVTGDPMFSLNYTFASAEDLGRQRPLSRLRRRFRGSSRTS